MSLLLELDSVTEQRVKSAASKNGTSYAAFVMDALNARLKKSQGSKALKRWTIAELLEEINRGMSEEEWNRYAALVSKRRRESLTRRELAELREISDQRERLNARRIELVFELSRRRGTTPETELQKLGIGPKHV